MAVNIGPRIGIEGESQYRKELQGIIEKSKALKAEMEAVSKGFKNAGDDSTDFERKTKVLGKQIENQQQIIDHYRELMESSADALGENASETTNYETKLYKAQATMADMQNQLSQLTSEEGENADQTEEVGDAVEDTGSAMDDASGKTSIFAETLKSQLTAQAIISGIKSIADAVKDIASSVKEAFTSTVDWADELATLSSQTGISNAELQKLQYMAGLVDVDVSTVTGSMRKLTKSMDSASAGSGASYEAFQKLGVSVKDANGELKSSYDVFYEVIDALGQVQNPTERDAQAMEIFGKSAQELNPMIEKGSTVLKEFGREAEESGYVLSDQAITGLTDVSDAFERVQNAGDSAMRNAFAPLAPTIATAVNSAIPSMQLFAQNLGAMFSGDMSVGDFTTFLMTKIQEMVTWITENLPTIMAIGTEIIVAILNGLAQGDIAGQAITLISTLQQGIADNLPQIMEAGVGLLVSLVTGLTQPSSLSQLIQSGLSLLLSLVKGIINALPQLASAVPQIIQNLVSTIIQNLPLIITSGIELIGALVVGLIQSIPDIILAIPQIISAIIEAFKGADWISIGTDIMNGIKNGLTGMVQSVIKSAKEIGTKILNGVKGVLGIASPSKVFRDEVGKMIPKGLEQGVDRGMPSVIKDMQSQMDNLVLGATATVGGMNAISPVGGSVMNYGGFTINVNAQDGQSAQDIADEVMYRIQNAVQRREAVFA